MMMMTSGEVDSFNAHYLVFIAVVASYLPIFMEICKQLLKFFFKFILMRMQLVDFYDVAAPRFNLFTKKIKYSLASFRCSYR